MNPSVYAIATMDTKGEEIAYIADILKVIGVRVLTLDVGTRESPTVTPDISREFISAGRAISTTDRGEAVTEMSQALREFLLNQCVQGKVAGVIGIGGSGGTALITTAMRALPIGLPKLMVSTVASGNTAPYVDSSDITMMYSVVDIAGLNAVSERILANAAHAMAGMVQHSIPKSRRLPTLGMTMFGVTTPCVTHVRHMLEKSGFDCLVFHATGTGGRAMEQLVESGLIGGVLDITTTEVADEIVGGVFPAGPKRFERLLERRIPLVLSLGAVDMVNFGAIETVPPQFKNRRLYKHNAQVTLMRTTVEENILIARWIAEKLNTAQSPWALLLPLGGVSMLDAPGQPFWDPAADKALFEELERCLQVDESRKVQRLPLHINDPLFAEELCNTFLALWRKNG
jgi:uncharacterized protein (UPF0261 family)